MFSGPIALDTGEIVNRDGFLYADFKLSSSTVSESNPPLLTKLSNQ